jgi:hypothetical protein
MRKHWKNFFSEKRIPSRSGEKGGDNGNEMNVEFCSYQQSTVPIVPFSTTLPRKVDVAVVDDGLLSAKQRSRKGRQQEYEP